ncbi:flagellar biosynthesis protein FliQ [Rickettsia endosymbiont of Cardiosporidium cionae]|uniref:flagellar biosynthesis protein FliQ n=1 Tax=Rickettsia endosymbiont of Cardiosporidium cionae TaxID=2777155 RepID=UPI001895AF78|nr:flagellar biosynthesis protein FliQ [Rickettsia endosymbiont of Cardiosporidium cionae]KAF8818282.1 hypothetical protein IHI24_000741 [Rickettsia endosymbiont of Cardiosporidium cionae]
MDIGAISEISKESIYTLIAISSPILISSLVVGLVISLIQALTQIQESTLTFVPKIITIFIVLSISAPYILLKLRVFVDHIIQLINPIYGG